MQQRIQKDIDIIIDLTENQKKYIEALNKINVLIEENPSMGILYAHRLSVYECLEDYPLIVSETTSILKSNTINYGGIKGILYGLRAKAYYEIGKYQDAISDSGKALSVDSDNSSVYAIRGMAYLALDSPDAAVREFNKAISIDDKNVDAYLNRAIVFAQKGYHDKSKEDLIKAQSLGVDIDKLYPGTKDYLRNTKKYVRSHTGTNSNSNGSCISNILSILLLGAMAVFFWYFW